MRIGIFSDSYEPQVDGAVSVIRTLKQGLQSSGHEVFIFTVQHPDAVPQQDVYRVPSVRLVTEPQYRVGLPVSPLLMRKARQLDLHIVHSHSPGPLGRLALSLARRQHIPIIHTSHTMYEERLHYLPFGRGLARRSLRFVARRYLDRHTAVVAPSQKMVSMLQTYGITVPVHLVPNGIPIDRFTSCSPDAGSLRSFRRRFGLREQDRVVVFVGRIAKEKALDVLLRNFARVLERRPATRLLIVGDGPESAALARLAGELGIGDRVVFAGYLQWPQEVSVALHASDLFVSASHTEVHPVSFLEALATGIPVVAYRDPSIEDMIVDGRNGFLISEKERMHEGILAVLDMDRERYLTLREGSLAMAATYSADAFVNRMLDIYRLYVHDRTAQAASL